MEDVPYGRILREGWLIILICALLGAGAAYGVAKLLPETYAATSTLLLQVDSTEASLFERNQFSLARIKTYPALVDSPEVIDAVRSDVGLSEDEFSDRDIRLMLSAENTIDTVLLTVRADAPTAAMAADMANSAARNLSEVIEATENSDNDDRYQVNLDQVLPAVEPLAPVSPQVLAIVGLGTIAGFAVGAIIAVFRTTTNRRLSTVSDVRRASGLAVVGRIPRRPRFAMKRSQAQTDAVEQAAFEDMINNLAALGGPGISRYVLIPVSVEGIDDEVLRPLLDAFAATGRRACALYVRASMPTGDVRPLTDVLTSDSSSSDGAPPDLSDADADGAIYATSTRIPMATLEQEIPAAMTRLSDDFDVVVLVTDPGASSLIESEVAAGAGVVLSVRQNATPATDLVSITTRLRVMGLRPLGVLMTHATSRSIGVAAESWRESDRQEVAPAAPAMSRTATAQPQSGTAVPDAARALAAARTSGPPSAWAEVAWPPDASIADESDGVAEPTDAGYDLGHAGIDAGDADPLPIEPDVEFPSFDADLEGDSNPAAADHAASDDAALGADAAPGDRRADDDATADDEDEHGRGGA